MNNNGYEGRKIIMQIDCVYFRLKEMENAKKLFKKFFSDDSRICGINWTSRVEVYSVSVNPSLVGLFRSLRHKWCSV